MPNQTSNDMNNETTLFKWTREDGKYVTIENGKLLAHNADSTVINPETDEAIDLFVEAFMVMRTELTIATLNDDEDEDFRIRRTIDKKIDYMMMRSCHNFGMNHGFMTDCIFNDSMGMFATSMFGRSRKSSYLNRDNNNGISDKEYFYKERKAIMDDFRESRQEEYDYETKKKQRIIDTAIPYEALSVCPANLITESNRGYQKQYGSTIIMAGHDIENRQLYNIIDKDDKFILPEHQLEISRITDDCFRIADKNNVYSYYDIRKKHVLFSAPANKRICSIGNALYYETDNNTTVCYDYDGNRIAEFTSDWKLQAIIGGRPVVSRELTEEEQKMMEHINHIKYYMYNIISEDGNLMFDQWQFDIYDIKYPNRFTTISQDGICSIYSTEDFSRIYTSEKPRRIKSKYYFDNSNENLFIFTQTVNFNEIEPGIIVNVETGEVISKDESGNPKDFERIEYPNPYNNGKYWKAMLSTKTKRMESIDPLIGKRIRNSKKQ